MLIMGRSLQCGGERRVDVFLSDRVGHDVVQGGMGDDEGVPVLFVDMWQEETVVEYRIGSKD